mmetsp:Transcript_45327/g.131885  ORF Transcript_45327/g.131885 Transcript_45327/m.131885 type:complete len:88 (+) Transcript_45327:375-638(+)
MFGSALGKTVDCKHSVNSVDWERGLGLFGVSTLKVVTTGGGPAVRAEDSVDIALAGEDSAVRILVHIDAIEICDETKIAERGMRFRG